MPDCTIKQESDGRQTDMRVGANVKCRARRIFSRTEVIEEHERPHRFVGVKWKNSSDQKTGPEIMHTGVNNVGYGHRLGPSAIRTQLETV